jgi:hypothetical protein
MPKVAASPKPVELDAVQPGPDFGPASSGSPIHGIGGIPRRWHLNRSGSNGIAKAFDLDHGHFAALAG